MDSLRAREHHFRAYPFNNIEEFFRSGLWKFKQAPLTVRKQRTL